MKRILMRLLGLSLIGGRNGERVISVPSVESSSRGDYRQKVRDQFRSEFIGLVKAYYLGLGLSEKEVNLGFVVNDFKRCLSLPLVSLDDYTHDQLVVWSKGMDQYVNLAGSGLTHPEIIETLNSKKLKSSC